MSTRCRHDLVGCKGRITSCLNTWRESLAQVQEIWNDATARAYYAEHFSETEETMLRMIASLQEAADMVRSFEKQVSDEEY
ncbi:MAG: hypothetical protein MUF23_01350 [Pirellula sp.]|nr:hypothetical protein [Pirellula sp.]